jgi:hypothetical protein
MENPKMPKSETKKHRTSLIVAFVVFGMYFVNVLIGKANVLYKVGLPRLGNVGEFLLLAGAATFLIIAALEREASEQKEPQKPLQEVKNEE